MNLRGQARIFYKVRVQLAVPTIFVRKAAPVLVFIHLLRSDMQVNEAYNLHLY